MTQIKTPFNFEGIVRTQVRDRNLLYGYELTPVIINDTNPSVAPEGTCFYQFRCLGSTNAVIDKILDIDANAVAGFAGVTITAADVPYNYRASSIQLTSGAVIAYLKNIEDL